MRDETWNPSNEWYSRHRSGVTMTIKQHSFLTPAQRKISSFLPPSVWCTYLEIFGGEDNKLVQRFWEDRATLESLPWNGEATLYERSVTVGSMGSMGTERRIKIGDDFAHSHDEKHWDSYDLDTMRVHIKGVAAALLAKLEAEGFKP